MARSEQTQQELTTETVRSIDDIPRAEWNHVVQGSNLGSVFHRYEWLAAVEAGKGLEGRHVIISKDGNPIAVFPNFITDIEMTPFKRLSSIEHGFGGPVIQTNERECLQAFADELDDTADGSVISHTIKPIDLGYVRYQSHFERQGYRPAINNCRFVLDLAKGWEDLLAEMSSSRRRSIRNAQSETKEVRERTFNKETLDELYKRYQSVMDRHGSEPHERAFFDGLLQMRDRTKIFSLSVDGSTRGMLLFLLDDEQSAVHYFISGITEADFEHDASELIHEHAIKWAIENGYETYDFGATSTDFEDGIFKYKERFGGRIVPTLSWEKGYTTLRWNAFRAARHLYKRYSSNEQ